MFVASRPLPKWSKRNVGEVALFEFSAEVNLAKELSDEVRASRAHET